MAHVIDNETQGAPTYTVRWRDKGKYRRKTFTVKRQAERFALRIEDTLHQGQSTDPYSLRGKTVADVIADSMAAARPNLKPRTYLSYDRCYKLHIIPTLGSKRISTLTSADVEQWVAELTQTLCAAKGRNATPAQTLSAATVRNTFIALNKVCRYAVRHRYMAANPCTGTVLPKASLAKTFHPRFLTAAEVELIAAQLKAHAPYDLIVRFAAYTGLRAGELAALRIRDINLLKKEVRVERNVQRIAGEWAVDTPKSPRSTRTVPILSEPLINDLTTYLATHPNRSDPEAALWPGRAPGNGHPTTYARRFDHLSFYRWYFKPAVKRAGLPALRFHDLRHTYASLMFAAGMDVYKVSRWMGHANISTTDSIYAHLYPQDHSADSERFAAYLALPATTLSPAPMKLRHV
jgi:integrase